MWYRTPLGAALMAIGIASGAHAETPAPAKKAPKKKDTVTLFGSWRDRQEYWDWFGNEGGKDRYTFNGSLLRFGATYTSPHNDFTFELAQPTLLGLPNDASLPAPLGQLGLGASYRDANGSQQANIFIKQGFWRGKNLFTKGDSLRAGRFEFFDGTEVPTKDSSLAWLKRERIAQRLIGNFGYTHVQRSFDGAQLTVNKPNLNVTVFGGMPTEGVVDLDGNQTLEDVHVGYAAATMPFTHKHFSGEARLFGIYYDDQRQGVVKTDNRPLPVRKADTSDIAIGTIGGHWVGVWDTNPGKFDGLLWGAGQFGDWGSLSQGALAYTAEAGFQPKGAWANPWFRAGYSHFSGDGNAKNGDHGTFFPILPTPRVYARFPFFTEMNLNDAFVQAMIKPEKRVSVRADIHFLSLASADDLWYGGGGAFQPGPSFGYSGRPSNSKTDLGVLYDISVDFQVRKYTTLSAYVGYADGGDVIDKIYKKSTHGLLAYLELVQKW